MKPLTFSLLSLLVFSSCKKDFAYFQKSRESTYLHKKNSIKTESKIAPIEPNLTASVDNSLIILPKINVFSPDKTEFDTKKIFWNDDRKKRRKKKNMGSSKESFIEKIFPNQGHKDQKSTKKRQNPVTLNSTIYTGFVILGIAIVLALVSLNSLSLLFGFASIILLYFGFKRFFRKKQRRDIFR